MSILPVGERASLLRASLRVAAVVGLTPLLACTSTSFALAPDGGSEKATSEHADASAVAPPADAAHAADAADATRAVDAGGSGLRITGDLSFGAVGCGSAAAAKTLRVENLAGHALTLSATLSAGASSPYAVAIDAANVAAGGVAQIRVTPKSIPSTSPVPGNYADTLTIQSTLDEAPVLVPITETAEGAILSFDTQAIPFGETPVSSAQSSTFHVVNGGNVAVTLKLALTTADASFSVSQTATTVASGDMLTAAVTFSPAAVGAQADNVAIVPAAGTALCSPLPAPLALTGVGENGGLAVSSNALTFGPTDCGTTAASQKVTLTNSGNAPLTWSAAFANTSPSPFTLSPSTTGALAAGASVALTVTPGPIPAVSSVQANFYGDALTFTTDVIGDAPHVVTLSETAHGAILAFNPTTVAFGDVPVGTTGTASFQVTNAGNAQAAVTVSSSNALFSASPTGSVTVARDAAADFTGSFTPTSGTTSPHGTFSLATSATLCAALPSPLTVTGSGTNGVVAFSPAALSFGNQSVTGFTACGTTASAQQVTFTNSGNESYTITPTLLAGASSPYTFTVSPTSGVVAAGGGTATVTVTPNAIPATSAVPGSYGDSLSVTTTAAGDTAAHVIALTQSAYGAILTGAPTTIAFPATPANSESTMPVAITNSGNAPAVLVWNGVSSTAFAFDQSVTAPPGGVTTSPNAYFLPTAAQAYTGSATFAVDATTSLCQPIPTAAVSLTGTGTNASTP